MNGASLPPEELPPGADRPGLRARFSGMAVDVSPLRESRNFRLLWSGQSISYIGTQISLVAIPFQIYELTGSTLAVGLVGLAELVPLLTFALLGGAVADATDRRRLILATEVGFALVSVGLLVNALLRRRCGLSTSWPRSGRPAGASARLLCARLFPGS